MKAIVEKDIGGDGAQVGVYVDPTHLSVQVKYPLEKIVDPIGKLLDKAVDKVEQWIPGDQKPLAEKLKAELREELVDLLAKGVS